MLRALRCASWLANPLLRHVFLLSLVVTTFTGLVFFGNSLFTIRTSDCLLLIKQKGEHAFLVTDRFSLECEALADVIILLVVVDV
jgi:hypothetical protein